MHGPRYVAAPHVPDLPVEPKFVVAPLGGREQVVPVAAPRLPDQPVEPAFVQATLGDLGRVVPAPDPAISNSSGTSSTSLPAIPISGASVTRDGYDDYSSGLSLPSIPWRPDTFRILLLCGGPDERPDSLYNLFSALDGFECTNYDIANGAQFDIVDDVVWDTIYTAVTSLEYAACVACPPCSTFSQLHSLPGPPPLRDATGPGRYGRTALLPPVKERVRKHTLIATRVAQILSHFTRLKVPWIFESPWASENQVSALNLDEYVNLLAMHGVTKIKGVQCPFGGRSSKPTAWVSHGVELGSMPTECPHSKRKWQNQRTGEVVHKPHAPTSGKDEYLLENPLAPWTPRTNRRP
jgi:hypothetical protein